MDKKTALITGASGLLGRAVYQHFKDSDEYSKVVGLCYSRSKGDLIKLDLLDKESTTKLFDEVKPNVIVHCAAERRPDVAETDTEKTLELNVKVSEHLAKLASDHNARLIYISTDYVFDGTSPPYHVNDQPNPLNFYGKSKLQGEIAVHQTNPQAVVLRVPVLYGEVEYPGESAVNILVDVVKDSSKKVTMDHHSARFPTNVKDVARVCLEMALVEPPAKDLPPILHYSAGEKFTKYEICQLFGKILGIADLQHIVPDAEVPQFNPQETSRPENCQLSVDVLRSIGLGTDQPSISFSDWFTSYLTKKV